MCLSSAIKSFNDYADSIKSIDIGSYCAPTRVAVGLVARGFRVMQDSKLKLYTARKTRQGEFRRMTWARGRRFSMWVDQPFAR